MIYHSSLSLLTVGRWFGVPMRFTAAAMMMAVVPWSSMADVVTEWNNAALEAVRTTKDNPPRATRRMAIEHIAIFDAVNGIQRDFQPYHVTDMAPEGASMEAAIAAAGYTTLYALYADPDVRANNFQALYDTQLAAIPDGQAKTDGIAWGEMVAQAILDLRANDGWDAQVPYEASGEIGRWKPTPPMFAAPLLPGWGAVSPFSMTLGSQFRPQAPPPVTSSAYAHEVNAVKAYGAAAGSIRTEDQTEIALFWNDNPGTETPPGHWNAIASEVSAAQGLTLLENVRLFALLNIALADAAISAWDCKFHYDYWRPIDAIREADMDGNPETEPDPAWEALIFMPPFPDYTSGHSTFSRSAATVLAGCFGTDAIPFTTTSRGTPGVMRSYPGFSAAADEAGISRIYGGIHYYSANYHGQASGYSVGRQVLTYYLQPFNVLSFARVGRADGDTELEFQGVPNQTYLVRASSDLKTWETIATLASADGVIRFTDPNAPEARVRFYVAEQQE